MAGIFDASLLAGLQSLLERALRIVQALGQLARIGDRRHQRDLNVLRKLARHPGALERQHLAGGHRLRTAAARGHQLDRRLASALSWTSLARVPFGNSAM